MVKPARHLLHTILAVTRDLASLVTLAMRSRAQLAAENLFLRKQLGVVVQREGCNYQPAPSGWRRPIVWTTWSAVRIGRSVVVTGIDCRCGFTTWEIWGFTPNRRSVDSQVERLLLSSRGSGPVLDGQVVHPLEFGRVVGHEREPERAHVGSD